MGYIKEPKGVYLIIHSSKLAQKEADEISNFIQKEKLKNKNTKDKLTAKALETIRKYNEGHS